MKDFGRTISEKEKAMKFTQMEIFTLALFDKEKLMGKECTHGNQERFMTENGLEDLRKETACGKA